MAFVSHIILIGSDHPNDGGLTPNYLIEVWENNRIVFVCKQLRSSGEENSGVLEEFRVNCKDPANLTLDLFKSIDKVLKKSRTHKLGSSSIAIVSLVHSKSDKVLLNSFETKFPKHNLYFFPLTDHKTWNRWQNTWDREGGFNK